MTKSILTDKLDTCYFCGAPKQCIHHVYGGFGRRMISDREGFTVPLCNSCHTMSNHAVHQNKMADTLLKRRCQEQYEAQGHSREEFIKLVGRNYLG